MDVVILVLVKQPVLEIGDKLGYSIWLTVLEIGGD